MLEPTQDEDNKPIFNFAGSMQKTTEEKLSVNGTAEEVQTYDESNFYENILKYGI